MGGSMPIFLLPWGLALLAYGLFLAWYVNWRGPLSKGEVQSALADLIATGVELEGRNDLATLQAFLEADDGREFFMLNLVRIAPGDIPDPVSGQPRPARQVMEGYTRMFLPALFARGGHPAIAARKIGGYFDAWGVEADPGWSIMGYMRYRSRRDLLRIAARPEFLGPHEYKIGAMAKTIAFPVDPWMNAGDPRLLLAMIFMILGLANSLRWAKKHR